MFNVSSRQWLSSCNYYCKLRPSEGGKDDEERRDPEGHGAHLMQINVSRVPTHVNNERATCDVKVHYFGANICPPRAAAAARTITFQCMCYVFFLPFSVNCCRYKLPLIPAIDEREQPISAAMNERTLYAFNWMA